jgi:hypothetical protein
VLAYTLFFILAHISQFSGGCCSELCKRMGLALGKEGMMDVNAVMAEMDRDGDQEVALEEFKAWWKENGNKNTMQVCTCPEQDDSYYIYGSTMHVRAVLASWYETASPRKRQ